MINVGQILHKNGVIKGKINARTFQGGIILEPVAKRGDSSPDFTIVHDAGYQTGAAWWKEGKNGSKFLTLTLDNDGMENPLYLTAFADESSPGLYDVVWSRPKLQQEGKLAA